MNETLEDSLHLAKLLYQKGDFLEAHSAFVKVEALALSCQNLKEWLESLRLQMQCLSELDQFNKAGKIRDRLLEFSRESTDAKLIARAHSLLAFYFIQTQEVAQAQRYLQEAIQQSTSAQDLECLSRTLMLEVYLNSLSFQENWDQALRSLEKVDLLLRSFTSVNLELTCLSLRAHIATCRGLFEEAGAYLWKAYEKAQTQGHHLLIPSLLFQLGRLHRDQGQRVHSQLFFELSLRGVDPVKHPRQYRLISQEARRENLEGLLQYDLIVHQEARLIRERQRGMIDFKNQHLLLDLALLFIKNPGQRFSKEEVLESVWNQAYDPGLHDNLIYVSIKRLRALLEPDEENPRYILRDRRGYYLNSNCSISFKVLQESTP